MERVSVVIPCYNEEKFIEQTLGCFEKQTFKDFEIVIINDNSTDNTVEVISNYVKKSSLNIKLYTNDKNMGISYSTNRGISLSVGEYIALMDADDICYSYRLQDEVDFLDKNQDFFAVQGIVDLVDENGVKFAQYDVLTNYKYLKIHNIFYCDIHNNTTMFRKKFIVDNKIKYRDDINGMQDWFFWGYCMSLGGKIGSIQKPLSAWRRHNDSLCNNMISLAKENMATSIRKELMELNGFKLIDNDFNILNKAISMYEKIDVKDKQHINNVYVALKKLTICAIGTEYEMEMKTFCRKMFSQFINFAYFLWE
jgi:glycosyltransferase involved in cell wall biosynthesis